MTAPLLAVRDLRGRLRGRWRRGRGRGRRLARRPAQPHRGAGRRERLGQDRDLAERSWASCRRNAPITGGIDLVRRPAQRRPGRSTSPPCRPDSPERRAIRGGRISIIFQEPMSSLSPLHTIGDQIGEALRSTTVPMPRKHAPRTAEMLGQVGFPKPEEAVDRYPVRALGRPAAAGDDRHGADLPAGPPDRRRADDGPRRHRPGPDPEADEGPAGRVRHVDPVHHP